MFRVITITAERLMSYLFGATASFYLIPNTSLLRRFFLSIGISQESMVNKKEEERYVIGVSVGRGILRGKRQMNDTGILLLVLAGVESMAREIVRVHQQNDDAKKLAQETLKALSRIPLKRVSKP